MQKSNSKLLWIVPVGLVFCSMLQYVAAQSYVVTDLGTPGGFTNGSGASCDAHCINSTGSVAGEWAPNLVSQRAFSYNGSTNNDIGLLTGMQYEAAYGINASDLVVGEAENDFGDYRAFLYTNGTLVDLTTVTYFSAGAPYAYSIAHGLNDSGHVVGESLVSSSSLEIHAVIFAGNGQSQKDLGTLTGGTYSAAYGINNSNVIVGESTDSSGNVYAFIYSNNVMSTLGTLPGGSYSAAFAINNLGEIAGETATSAGETHAFVFEQGAMTDLGTFGGTNSSATAINSAGMAVGYALTADENQHAFLYNGTTMLDLNNLVLPSAFTNLISAEGINDAGQITGAGYTTNGVLHAFLLTPILNAENPKILAGHQFQLTVQGIPGQQFILKGSTNLQNWVSLSTNTLSTYSLNCVDSNAPYFPNRFYRVQALP